MVAGEATAGGHRRAVAGLLALSLLWALGSLRREILPAAANGALPPMARQAMVYALASVVALAAAASRRAAWPSSRQAWAWTGVGVGLFVLPAALAAMAGTWIGALERVAIFSLTPVIAVVIEPHLGAGRTVRGGLQASLLVVAGSLGIFPLDLPGSWQAGAAVGLVVLAAASAAAANCCAVRLAGGLARGSLAAMAALSTGAAAGCFAVLSAVTERAAWRWQTAGGDLAWAVAIDLPAVLLLFWLLRRLTAAAMTTRFVLAPGITVGIGIALEQAAVTARLWVGMALVAAGALWLLRRPESEGDVSALRLG
jgi:drug/metabolite transporter (DMT)-like permease